MNTVKLALLVATGLFYVFLGHSLADDQIDYAGIEALVQQDKNDEAKARLDALIKQYPDNAKLKQMRESLSSQVPPPTDFAATTSATKAAPPAAPAPPPESTLDDASKIQLDTIMLDGNQANSQTDQDARATAWKKFLDDGDSFVQAHPDFLNIWLYRGQAAYELNLPKQGYEAGSNLLRLGALTSSDPSVHTIIGELGQKGWLVGTYSSFMQTNAAPLKKEVASLRAKIDSLNQDLRSAEANAIKADNQCSYWAPTASTSGPNMAYAGAQLNHWGDVRDDANNRASRDKKAIESLQDQLDKATSKLAKFSDAP